MRVDGLYKGGYAVKSFNNKAKNKNILYVNKPNIGDEVSFSGLFSNKKDSFEIGLSMHELKKRTSPLYFEEKKMLDVNAPEFLNLALGDKRALAHLTNAAYILNEAALKQDSSKNIPFRDFLIKKAASGDKKAQMALSLFEGQNGVFASDREANKIVLIKGTKKAPGRGFYPDDLTLAELQSIIKKMLQQGEVEEVKKILNQRSIIKRNGDKLRAIDYTEEYRKEFQQAADELDNAARFSTNKDFNTFLRLQAKALRENNPMADALADKKWATLQDTPLEFTITREGYDEVLTEALKEDKELAKMIDDLKIPVFTKDSIGIRVGVVNKEGTRELLDMQKYLPIMAQNMPLKDKYIQNISANAAGEIKQTMVDVDLVTVVGDAGKYRAGITLAENLPNDDKWSLTIGGGRRNVYHRQIRMDADPQKKITNMRKILSSEIQQYYNPEADHWFTELHENMHSCGPKRAETNLGRYANVIEENKADMGGLSVLDELVKAGKYSEKEKKEILTTFVAKEFNAIKRKPGMDKPHRVRTVMQLNYLMQQGGIKIKRQGLFGQKGIIGIDFDKMISGTKKMLEEIITIQLEDKAEMAEKYVNRNFVWSKEIEIVAKQIRKMNKVLNGFVNAPLAKQLLKSLK